MTRLTREQFQSDCCPPYGLSAMQQPGFACSGRLALRDIKATAAEAESLGYGSVWITVLAGITDPAAALDAALEATQRIRVGLGLVPLDAFDPVQLGRDLRQVPARAIVGFGVGKRRLGAGEFWYEQVSAFRAAAGPVQVAVGGYGPAVLHAGGRLADAVLLNWMTPARVQWALGHVDRGASAAGRVELPRPAFVYVPTALEPDATGKTEAALRHMATHAYHRRHQAMLEPDELLNVPVDRTSVERIVPPSPGPGTAPVIYPLDAESAEERRVILRTCAPGRRMPA